MTKQLSFKQGDPGWEHLREKARTDLYWLNSVILQHKDVVPMTHRAHYAACRFAERKTGIPEVDAARIQLLQLPRGVGKTTLITKALPIQHLLQNQDASIGIANEKQDNANAFLGMIKQEFETNDRLQALFPELIPDFKKTEWRSDRIVIQRTRSNAVNPSVLATGVGGTVTGVHMDCWIVDDLISQDAAENARAGLFTEIDKANRWVGRLQPLLKNPKRDRILFIGTPWFANDTYSHLVEGFFGKDAPRREYLWQIELPKNKDGEHEIQTIHLYVQGEIAVFRLPAIDEDGRPLFPERYTLDELDKMRAEDPYFFSSQYLLQPSAGSASEFKPDWLKQLHWETQRQIRFRNEDGRAEFARLQDMTCIISVDPAISRAQTAARSAVSVCATDGKRIFLLESWARRVGATDLANKILQLHLRYQPYRIVIETVAYQEALAEVLHLLARQHNLHDSLPIYEFKPGSEGKKEVRILGLEPFFRKGLFYYEQSQTDFYDEYCNYPNHRLRDILDSLAMQKDLWDQLATGNPHSGNRLKAWSHASKQRASAIREHFARKSRAG